MVSPYFGAEGEGNEYLLAAEENIRMTRATTVTVLSKGILSLEEQNAKLSYLPSQQQSPNRSLQTASEVWGTLYCTAACGFEEKPLNKACFMSLELPSESTRTNEIPPTLPTASSPS